MSPASTFRAQLAACEPLYGAGSPIPAPLSGRLWAAAAGNPAGIHASDGATARLYRDGGCSLITVATDALAISRCAATELATAQD